MYGCCYYTTTVVVGNYRYIEGDTYILSWGGLSCAVVHYTSIQNDVTTDLRRVDVQVIVKKYVCEVDGVQTLHNAQQTKNGYIFI